MSKIGKYNEVFAEIFNISAEELSDDFSAETVDSWDSITQLSLVTGLEEAFDVMFDSEDILAMRSYKIGKDILGKYGVKL